MKSNKLAILLMAFAITAITPMFTSCSSGDDNEEDIYSPDGNETNDNEKISGLVNGHEAVDLGLSVKWATCNIGTTKPEYFGNYYGWGDPTGKKHQQIRIITRTPILLPTSRTRNMTLPTTIGEKVGVCLRIKKFVNLFRNATIPIRRLMV